MIKIKKTLMLLGVVATLVFTAGCSKTEKNVAKEAEVKPVTLTISAAASLKDSFEELKEVYVRENQNVNITYNFGSSGTLQKQIDQGAEADIFISAANKQMDALKGENLIVNDSLFTLLENSVVLVVPNDSDLTISDFKDLTDENIKKIALGEPSTVPAGQYAEEVLTNVGVLDQVKSKAVYAKDVKEVLTWVESGNVDAGIVYGSDAKTSDKVKVIATAAEESHSPVQYPAAVISTSKNQEEANKFLDFLCSDKAKEVLEKDGFAFIGK